MQEFYTYLLLFKITLQNLLQKKNEIQEIFNSSNFQISINKLLFVSTLNKLGISYSSYVYFSHITAKVKILDYLNKMKFSSTTAVYEKTCLTSSSSMEKAKSKHLEPRAH